MTANNCTCLLVLLINYNHKRIKLSGSCTTSDIFAQSQRKFQIKVVTYYKLCYNIGDLYGYHLCIRLILKHRLFLSIRLKSTFQVNQHFMSVYFSSHQLS